MVKEINGMDRNQCSTKAIAQTIILFPLNAYSATVFSFYTKFRNKSQPNSFVFLQ